VGVDVERPNDVAGLDPVTMEAPTGDRRGLPLYIVGERVMEALDGLLDQEHPGIRVVEVPHRAVRAVPGVLLDVERGLVGEGGRGDLRLDEDVIRGHLSGEGVDIDGRQCFGHIRSYRPSRPGYPLL